MENMNRAEILALQQLQQQSDAAKKQGQVNTGNTFEDSVSNAGAEDPNMPAWLATLKGLVRPIGWIPQTYQNPVLRSKLAPGFGNTTGGGTPDALKVAPQVGLGQ